MPNWQSTSLAEISSKPQYGAIARGTAAPDGPLFVRQTDIASGRIDWSSVPHCDLKKDGADRYALKRGDLLISRLGNGVGNAATVAEDRDDAVFAGYLVRFQPHPTIANARFVGYQLQSQNWKGHVRSFRSGAAQPTLNAQQMGEFSFLLPSLSEQRAIVETLGALDDKIESNRRQRVLLRSLGRAEYVAALGFENRNFALGDATLSIARGVAPKYADADPSAPLVVNQKCIRDGWVSLVPARRMQERAVAPAKRATGGDILVNSTGTGTLGRVARWHEGSIFVDGHVTVVKPDPTSSPPTVLAYSLLGRESEIVELSTGSTGQTELSPTRLASLTVTLPKMRAAEQLEPVLLALESRSAQLASESARLAALRDALLPELLSGSLRTPAAAS